MAIKNLSAPEKDKIFSDEKKFQASPSTKIEYCTREVGEEYDLDKVIRGSLSSSKSIADVNIWAYIGPFGKGNLFLQLFRTEINIKLFDLFYVGEIFLAENIKVYNPDGTQKAGVTKEMKKQHSGMDNATYLDLI